MGHVQTSSGPHGGQNREGLWHLELEVMADE